MLKQHYLFVIVSIAIGITPTCSLIVPVPPHVNNGRSSRRRNVMLLPTKYRNESTGRKISLANTSRSRFMSGDDQNETSKSDEVSSSSIEYKSWSTASIDPSSQFHQGSEERKRRLHEALSQIGMDPESFTNSPEFQDCTAAQRTYSSFVLPKNKGALAMTEQPKRAKVVANSIAFLLKEHRSHTEEWLRNHDRALEEIEAIGASARNPIIVVLDNVRSAPNVGNILRAAEAAKCTSVLLCGSMTPAPPHPKILKTAMGAAEYVPQEIFGSTLDAIRTLKERGVRVIGVETTSRSIPLWKSSFFDTGRNNDEGDDDDDDGKVAFVFGNEMIGVDVDCLEECDELIALPTHGVKNSLNVATCVSVVIWEALRQLDELKSVEERTE
jgi:23S rRNA (guanosine2251-2'-O)-methyltransferase